MDILKIADGVTGLFPKKITVTVVDDLSGNIIGAYKVAQAHLPLAFNRPTLLEFEGQEWRLVKAEPLYAKKRLILRVQEEEHFRAHNTRSLVPTVAWPIPKEVEGPADGPVLTIKPEEWRQIEFLPAGMEEVVEKEMKEVERVTEEAGEEGLLGYDEVYRRERIGENLLNIPFDEFCELVKSNKKEIIGDKFLVDSTNHTYYGIVIGDYIRQLHLLGFDSADEEITDIITTYDFIIADWLNYQLI